jgi:hypothetical protein
VVVILDLLKKIIRILIESLKTKNISIENRNRTKRLRICNLELVDSNQDAGQSGNNINDFIIEYLDFINVYNTITEYIKQKFAANILLIIFRIITSKRNYTKTIRIIDSGAKINITLYLFIFCLGLLIEKYKFFNIKFIGKKRFVFVGFIQNIIFRINNINTRFFFF